MNLTGDKVHHGNERRPPLPHHHHQQLPRAAAPPLLGHLELDGQIGPPRLDLRRRQTLDLIDVVG
jgi:hypothetical protein